MRYQISYIMIAIAAIAIISGCAENRDEKPSDDMIICTADYRPVCGVDGNTYGNKCMADAAKIQIVKEGECQNSEDELIACTLEYAPVCGTDGKTYGNRCMADAAKVAIAKEGECSGVGLANPASENCINVGGTLEMRETPEGTVGICKLYFGLECDEWELFRGECPKEQTPCTREYIPVCGADGVTYGNRCELVNAHTTFSSEGECP